MKIEGLIVTNDKKYSLLCLHLFLVKIEGLIVWNKINILCFVYIYF